MRSGKTPRPAAHRTLGRPWPSQPSLRLCQRLGEAMFSNISYSFLKKMLAESLWMIIY